MRCTKCNRDIVPVYKQVGPHLGMYCPECGCGAWLKWVRKGINLNVMPQVDTVRGTYVYKGEMFPDCTLTRVTGKQYVLDTICGDTVASFAVEAEKMDSGYYKVYYQDDEGVFLSGHV